MCGLWRCSLILFALTKHKGLSIFQFEGNRKEFWAIVGRRTKGKRNAITALRNSAGVSVTSTSGSVKEASSALGHL